MPVRWTLTIKLGFILLLATLVPSANGQGIASGLLGDFGMKSGSQPPSGSYLTAGIYFYHAGRIKTSNGSSITGGSFNLFVNYYDLYFVTKKKIFGANYAFRVDPAISSSTISTPTLDSRTGVGFADLYVEPLNLGWHFPRVDVLAIYGFTTPTGRFQPGAEDNTGLGQWANSFGGGFTLYPDEKKQWSIASIGWFQIHSGKRDSDVRIGNTLILEGGVGKSVRRITAGLAYYTLWKVSDDQNQNLPPALRGKDRRLALGPEFDITFGTKQPVVLTTRYYFEIGNRNSTQGNTLILMATWIIPSK